MTDPPLTVPSTSGQKVGYARISTTDQTPDLQHDALNAEGCAKVFTDIASGKLAKRPQLNACLEYLRPGDTLCVYALDRLGRSLKDLIAHLEWVRSREIGFISLRERLDTNTPTGQLLFHIFGSIAEFEHELIRERVTAGLAAARARGRKGGRRPVMTVARIEAAQDLLDKGKSVTDAAKTLGVSRTTLYRHLDSLGAAPTS